MQQQKTAMLVKQRKGKKKNADGEEEWGRRDAGEEKKGEGCEGEEAAG